MGSGVFWMSGILAGVAALLSQFGTYIAIGGVKPDLLLILLVFYANSEGPLRAQTSGIVGGIVEDLMSLSPFGFHLLLRTTLAFIFGQSRNKIFLDPLVMPALMVLAATLVKGLLALTAGALFRIESVTTYILSTSFLIEIGYNALLGPLLFLFYGFLKRLVGTKGIRVVG
ncbi:MAG: rod shape-determining protein MreD [Spirochaetaceae bacterium]